MNGMPKGRVIPDLAMPALAQADPGEQVLMRYCQGSGSFSPDKKFINLQLRMFDPYGQPDGEVAVVLEALFTTPQELFVMPPQPRRPFDVAGGPPLPAVPVNTNTKGIWTFADGSSITAVGPAIATITPLPDGALLFMNATIQWITGGTGRWAGAWGMKSFLGSTRVPPGVDLFSPSTTAIESTTIDTFRVVPGPQVG